MELISMTCRNCGGKLKISQDADQFICQHCGTEYLVSFHEGAISIKLLAEGVRKIQESTDKTASELAIARLKLEIANISNVLNQITLQFAEMFDYKITNNNLTFEEVFQTMQKELAEQRKKYSFNPEKVKTLEKILQEFKDLRDKLKDKSIQLKFHEKVVSS